MTGTTSDIQRSRSAAVALPVDPFTSNRYHYGMLLGVADLEAEQAYHRGKVWLHNAWLHGAGAIWGLRIERSPDGDELIVRRGLAIDHHGRELWLAGDECVDLEKWLATLSDADLSNFQRTDGNISIVAHVRLCARHCLDRPVPSIAEPCGDSSSETAYSRTIERAKPELVLGEPPDVAELYPGLWKLAEHTDDGDAVEVDDRLDAGTPSPKDDSDGGCGSDFEPTDPPPPPHDGDQCPVPSDESCVERWHRTAVEDTMTLIPADSDQPWSPYSGDGCVTLARLTFTIAGDADERRVEGSLNVDNNVRPVHLPTTASQTLLWQALCCCEETATPESAGNAPHSAAESADRRDRSGKADDHSPKQDETPGAAGFRVVADEVSFDDRTIVIPFNQPAARASVRAVAFSVMVLSSERWSTVEVRNAGSADDDRSVTLNLATSIAGARTRVVVHGTGEEPIVSSHFAPLCGCEGEITNTTSGSDAVIMRDLSGSETGGAT